jgi:hypothetical protein
MLTAERGQQLREQLAAGDDPLLERYFGDVVTQAEEYASQKPLNKVLHMGRMCWLAEEVLNRSMCLGLAWLLGDREDLGRAGVAQLLSAARFDDWCPGHGLDYCGMSAAVGVGLDWLDALIEPDERTEIVTALREKGLEVGLEQYTREKGPHWMNWILREYNWNQVCNGGQILGALAVADELPELAGPVVDHAVRALPVAMASYAPEGVWGEGVNYWHFGTRFAAMAISTLESALGSDFGLTEVEGLSNTGRTVALTTGPTDLVTCFADSSEREQRRPMAEMFWLADRFGDDLLADWEHETLESNPAGPEHLLWYVPRPSDPPGRPLDACFRGPTDLVSMRSRWGDEQAVFIVVKSGFNRCNHAHMDVGSFELDALGVRWIEDLGKESYELKGYWDRHKDEGRRWTYFRLGSLSHNVPLLNESNQLLDAATDVTRFRTEPGDAAVVMDLSSAYPAAKMHRGFALLPGRRSVLVQDEWTLGEPGEICFNFLTRAEVKTREDGITLRRDGQTVEVRILGGREVRIESAPAKPEPPEMPNEGVSRVRILADAPVGESTLAVQFVPHWPDGKAEGDLEIVPLVDWPGRAV